MEVVLSFCMWGFGCWQDGSIVGAPKHLLQHVLETPTVNFISSPDNSFRQPGLPSNGDPIRLPLSFFINPTVQSMVKPKPLPGLPPPKLPKLAVPYSVYRTSLQRQGPFLALLEAACAERCIMFTLRSIKEAPLLHAFCVDMLCGGARRHLIVCMQVQVQAGGRSQ